MTETVRRLPNTVHIARGRHAPGDPLSEADLATIAARADAATPGPWWAWDRGVGWHIATEDPNATADVPALLPEGIRTDLGRREDAEFIAHAREYVPRLVAEVRRLRAHHEHCAWGACGSCEDVALERDAAQADLELLRARVAELEQALARAEAAEQERDDPRKDAYRAHPGVGDVDDTPLLHCARWESILADIQAAADALLMAAITLRDLYGAMPPRLRATCPPDLANRIESTRYQDAFDALPAGIRAAAEAAMRADPDIVAARRIHASGGSHADI